MTPLSYLQIGAPEKERLAYPEVYLGSLVSFHPWHAYLIHLFWKAAINLLLGSWQNLSRDLYGPWDSPAWYPNFDVSQLGPKDCQGWGELNKPCLSNENYLFKNAACLVQWHLNFTSKVSTVLLRKLYSQLYCLNQSHWPNEVFLSEVPLNACIWLTDGSAMLKPNGIL